MDPYVAPWQVTDTTWRQAFRESNPELVNDEHPDCPGCNPWQFNVRPLFADERFSLVAGCKQVDTTPDSSEVYAIIPGLFVFVPRAHTIDLAGLAPYMSLLPEAAEILHLEAPYSLTFNYGIVAGQTLAHEHFWFVNRRVLSAYPGHSLATLLIGAV